MMLKRILLTAIFLLFGFLFVSKLYAAENEVNLYFFWSKTCSHCAREESFLEKISPDYPNLKIHDYEIGFNRENALLLQKIGEELGIDTGSVPMTFIGDEFFVGYFNDEVTGAKIISLIKRFSQQGDPDLVGKIIEQSVGSSTPTPTRKEIETPGLPEEIKIPLLGVIQIKNLSLPALTFVIALLDGFNPCAMWVLLFLISLLLGMKDRLKMWILGSAFIITSSLVYFLFLAAWLNLFLFLGFVTWVRVAIGLAALVLGIYQLRDYVKNKEIGCKVEGGEKRRKVFEAIKDITQKREFLLALVGIILLAFAVNLVELVCSAGLPAVYTQILALTQMPKWQYYLYLIFYILIFMIDDFFVFIVAMVTLNAVGVQSKYARYSRLIGGLIILLIGILMLFKPEILMFA